MRNKKIADSTKKYIKLLSEIPDKSIDRHEIIAYLEAELHFEEGKC